MENPVVIVPVVEEEEAVLEERIAPTLVIKKEPVDPSNTRVINLEHRRLLWSTEREPISTCTWLNISLCPCFLLGHVTSRIEREDPCLLSCTTCCGCWPMGSKGWWTCFQTGSLAILGWPISPFLSISVFCQRRHFRSIYVEDTNEKKMCDTFCICLQDVCDSCFLRPCVLWQHLQYLKRKENEGLLRYHWETDVTLDLYRNPVPPTETKIIFIVGPKGCGKTTLFRKLLLIMPGDEAHEKLKDDGKIQIGIRCVEVGKEKMSFMECWDVPESAMYSSKFNAAIREGIHAIIFMFDASDPRNDYNNDNDYMDAMHDEAFDMGPPNTKSNTSSFGRMLRMHEHFESYLTHEISTQQQASPLPSQQRQSRPHPLEPLKSRMQDMHKVCVAGVVDGLSDGHGSVAIHRLSTALHKHTSDKGIPSNHPANTDPSRSGPHHHRLFHDNNDHHYGLYVPAAKDWAMRHNFVGYCETSSERNEGFGLLVKTLMMEQSSPPPLQPSQPQQQPQPSQEPILAANESFLNPTDKDKMGDTDGDGLLPRSTSLSGIPNVTNNADDLVNNRASI